VQQEAGCEMKYRPVNVTFDEIYSRVPKRSLQIRLETPASQTGAVGQYVRGGYLASRSFKTEIDIILQRTIPIYQACKRLFIFGSQSSGLDHNHRRSADCVSW
jgi:hypothetical protein